MKNIQGTLEDHTLGNQTLVRLGLWMPCTPNHIVIVVRLALGLKGTSHVHQKDPCDARMSNYEQVYSSFDVSHT